MNHGIAGSPPAVGRESAPHVATAVVAAGAAAADPFPWQAHSARIARANATSWRRRYATRLLATDAVVTAATLLLAGIWIGLDATLSWRGGPRVEYSVAISAVWLAWMLMLWLVDSRDVRIVGHGVTEYRKVVHAGVFLFAGLVIVAFFLRIDLSRLFFFTAIPIGTVVVIASRWGWRQWLRRRQRRGTFVDRAVIVGERAKIDAIARVIANTEGTGYQIVGAITARGHAMKIADHIGVIGDYQHAVESIEGVGANTVIVASADDLDPETLRTLSWQMADRDITWVVAPAMTDIAGPRIHARPVAGLPLVEVAFPMIEGGNRILKRAMDIAGSLLLLILSSPLMLAAAVTIRITSPGPVFYTQPRVGQFGNVFGMIKLRSMIPDADDQLASLLDLQGRSDRPLFKVNDDPRITPFGRFMRRHSIDELPQLLNVLRGDMSLVGPRPQRPAEVSLYDDKAHRRLILKPGMSGLWQVSGRSKLSWEQALRLDLYYVENWSFVQDVIILGRTLRAVIRPENSAS
ncbi:sugar transferase [Microbacterium terrae]|nr:polyprenyl glycosylphosphotransferase [Microbacterium terrae]